MLLRSIFRAIHHGRRYGGLRFVDAFFPELAFDSVLRDPFELCLITVG